MSSTYLPPRQIVPRYASRIGGRSASGTRKKPSLENLKLALGRDHSVDLIETRPIGRPGWVIFIIASPPPSTIINLSADGEVHKCRVTPHKGQPFSTDEMRRRLKEYFNGVPISVRK